MKTTNQLFGIVILTFGVLFHAHAQSWLTNGLVGYYPFNGNANDASGNGHNGTIVGDLGLVTLTNGVDGTPNSAYRFAVQTNTTDTRIEGTGINLSNSSLSVTLWFKKDYTNYALPHGGLVRLGVVGPAGGETGKSLHIAVNYSGAALRFSFFFDDFDVATPVGNGNWSHIACTYDNVTRERRIYVNGSLIATNIAVRGFSGPTSFDFHAAGPSGAGLIDQVRFYNRVLSSNEVATLRLLESGPHVDLIKAVKPALSSLLVGTNYQLQLSGDLLTWTNHGASFAATNSYMVYPQYWDVDNWDKLFFRLQVAP